MRNPNYLVLAFLILLAGTILVRTVAIAQHAYNRLLQPPIREAPGYLISAVAHPERSQTSQIMNSDAVEKPNLIEHHFPDAVAESIPDAVSPAKHQRPPQIGSERPRKNVAVRRPRRERNAFAFDRPWRMWW
jgi:hypothetical protein